jgi:hypothetical protein
MTYKHSHVRWKRTEELEIRKVISEYLNRVLRRIFGLKRDEVTEGWRKLCNQELRNLYTLPSIIRMIQSRRMGWQGM